MNSSVPKKNRIKTKMRGLAILLVLFVLVLLPVFSSAEDLPDVDEYHGWLEITSPKRITIPFKDTITTDDVLKATNPTTVLKRPTYTVTESTVVPVYSLSDKDLGKLNKASNINESVVVTLEAAYTYHCSGGCNQDRTVTGNTNIHVNFTAPVYTITFSGNGGTVDGAGTQIKTLPSQDKNGSAAGSIIPSNVKRDGYKFMGWSLSKDKNIPFTSDSIVTGDVTVYALWQKTAKPNKPDKPDKPDKPSQKEPLSVTKKHTATETRFSVVLGDMGIATGSNGGDSQNGNGSDNNSGNNTKVYTKAEFVSLAQEQNVPVANIGNGSVPLFAPEGAGGWAFVNLLLAVMGIIMALACLIISLKDGRSIRSIWFVVTAAAGVVGLVLFFITENFKLNMVLTDQWTAVGAVLFVVTVVGMILFLRKKEDPEEFIYKY